MVCWPVILRSRCIFLFWGWHFCFTYLLFGISLRVCIITWPLAGGHQLALTSLPDSLLFYFMWFLIYGINPTTVDILFSRLFYYLFEPFECVLCKMQTMPKNIINAGACYYGLLLDVSLVSDNTAWCLELFVI